MFKTANTKLKDVLLIKPEVFEDHRGQFIELYNEEFYRQNRIKVKFIQDDISISSKGVLRGIHGDKETWKLTSCLLGKLYLVIVNCDKNSSEFRKWQSFILSDKNRYQVLVPPKYGVAHLALSSKIILHYKQSTYYNPRNQFTYKWNDPKFKIWWPVKNPILSQRDELGHYAH